MKEQEIKYYNIIDKQLIGKVVIDNIKKTLSDFVYFDKKWTRDSDNVIMDRLLGVDETEPEDSPYRFGNSEMLNAIEEISEEEAANLILRYY